MRVRRGNKQEEREEEGIANNNSDESLDSTNQHTFTPAALLSLQHMPSTSQSGCTSCSCSQQVASDQSFVSLSLFFLFGFVCVFYIKMCGSEHLA